MAKAPAIKFPRIEAGFYGITLDGEFVGYVMKEVDLDSKETSWYIFDDNEQGKDVAMLHPKDAIDNPDSLLREAKDSAKKYFLNRPEPVEAISPISPLKESEWTEDEPESVLDEPSDEDLIEDDNLFISDDGDFEAFEDELLPLNDDDDLEFDTVEEEDLALV